MVKEATKILSEKLETTVEIKSINISFFNKVSLKGVYVQDLDKDTLLYVNRLSITINKLPIRGNTLSIKALKLNDGVFHLKNDTTGANISRIIKNLSKDKTPKIKDTTKKKKTFELYIQNLELENFAFTFYKYEKEPQKLKPNAINFKDIGVDSIYLKANKIKIHDDTISFNVKSLALNEKSGYRINKLSTNSYIVPGKDIHFDNLELIDDYSDIKLKHYGMTYNGAKEFSNFLEEVVLSGELDSANISFHSIGFFAPPLQSIPIKITASGFINGPIANLKSNDLDIRGFNNTLLKGRFNITGLPDINQTIIFADFKHLSTHPKDIFRALSKVQQKRMDGLEKFLENVQNIDFRGSFTGLYNDFVANGYLATNLGTLKLDVLFKTNEQKSIKFNGQVATSKFEAGKLLKTNFIGYTSFNLMTKGQVPNNGSLELFSEGVISELLLNDYKYNNIKLSGSVKDSEFNGAVNVIDNNVDFSFLGKVKYKGTPTDPIPEFNFSADFRKLDLAKLNFNKRDSIAEFKGKILANFKGDNITNYIGEIILTDASYKGELNILTLDKLSLISKEESGKSHLQLTSKYIDANYTGSYKFGEFINELKSITYSYLPSLNTDEDGNAKPHQRSSQFYDLQVKLKKPAKIAAILQPGLYISDNSNVNLYVDSSHKAKLHLDSKQIKLNDNKFDDIVINVENVKDSLKIDAAFSNILFSGLSFQNVSLGNIVSNNSITTHISYDNSNESINTGNLNFTTKLSRNFNELQKSDLNISTLLQKSAFVINDSTWRLAPANITFKNNRLAISNFKFFKENDQYLDINGAISKNPNDTITIKLKNYDLKSFNINTKSIGYEITGNVSGMAEITDVYNLPLVMINVTAKDVTINKDTLGNITVASFWDEEYERLNIVTRIFNKKEINANINGYINPKNSYLQFDMNMYKLKFGYIEPLLKGIASNIHGNMDGQLLFRGNFKSPQLTGKINLNQTSLMVDYLQTTYKLNATINIEKSKISILNGSLFDLNNNPGKLNVTLTHNNFKNIAFEASATINNMLCMNTKEADNPLFYGKSYATGGILIKGTPKDIHFNITAQAEKNSSLFIPLSSTSEAKKISMLTFKAPENYLFDIDTVITPKTTQSKSHIDFSLDLSVTPETEIQILIDKKAGDILRAQGQGNLKINVDPSINLFNIVGDYQISKGDYNFTLPNFNFISRKFNIDEGSQINFNGDVTSATLNVKASYRTRASILPLTPGDTTKGAKRYPVDCQILITGRMSSPTLKFNIDFPTLDSETKTQVLSSMNTEEKVTTQFLSLLVMQAFVPEQQYGNSYGTSSVLSNATDLLSGQIGNLISLLDLPVPLDVAVDLGVDNNQQVSDFEVSANTLLFNRVILNGSVGNNTQRDRQLVGDFEMEILLGNQGKYRLKVFTRSSDYFTNELESNMQGAGISYQTEFDNFIELFKRKRKKKNISTPLEAPLNKREEKENNNTNNKN